MTPDAVAVKGFLVGFTALVLHWEILNWEKITADDRCELSTLLRGLNCWWHVLRSVDVSRCTPEVRDMAADIETKLMIVYPLVYNRLALEKLSPAKSAADTYFSELRAEYENLTGCGRALVQALNSPLLLSHYDAVIT